VVSEEKKKKGEVCPECGSSHLVHDYETGEIVCTSCGLVIQERVMDEGPEWRAFTQEEKEARSRVGVPISYSVHDKGLSTSISKVDRDVFGHKLPLSTRMQMWRLRKWQIRSRVHSSIDRNLAQAMAELDRLCDKVVVPSPVKERAAMIYRKALEKGLVRGRSIAAIAAAALYVACRLTGTPKTIREIATASLVSRKDVARCYRLLLKELDIKMPVADPLIYLPKIAEKAGISAKTRMIAVKLIEEAKKKRVVAGKDPLGIAAAALYIACMLNNERKTQKEIAQSASVTEVTIRNRYKGLKRVLNLDLPD